MFGRSPTADEWRAARALLDRQPSLRSDLADLLRSFPRSGLYSDEQRDDSTAATADGASAEFASFVERVRSSLALSPRTVLLRAVDSSLADLFRTDPARMGELCSLLGLSPLDALNARSLADAVSRRSRGKLHGRWRAARDRADRTTTRPPWEVDAESFREKIAEGLRKKKNRAAAADDRVGGRGGGGSDDDRLFEDEVDAAVRRAVENESDRREKATSLASKLEAQLETDAEHSAYLRIHELWERTGAKDLWESYLRADREEGRERRGRGGGLEEDRSALLFCAIVLSLEATATPDPPAKSQEEEEEDGPHRQPAAANDGTTEGALPVGDRLSESYRYTRGALWLDADGKRIGEVDLAVLRRRRGANTDASSARDGDSRRGGWEVAALCEIKSGCLEVASALGQHESKLSSALLPSGSGSDDDDAGGGVRLAARDGVPLSLPDADDAGTGRRPVALFVATVLPKSPILGVEPALSRAICDGIRDQGSLVRDATTAAAARDATLEALLESGLSRTTLAREGSRAGFPTARAAGEGGGTAASLARREDEGSAAGETPPRSADGCVDLAELERFVRRRMGPEGLRESPLAGFLRCRERSLVICGDRSVF